MPQHFKLSQLSVVADFPVGQEQTAVTATRVTAIIEILWR